MRFYRFEDTGLPGALPPATCLSPGAVLGEADRCPLCGAFVSMLRWLPPYAVELELLDPKPWPSAITAGASDLLVSPAFVRMWQEESLRGVEGFEAVTMAKVRRRAREKTPLPEYRLMQIPKSHAFIDDAASGLHRLPGRQPGCRWCGGGDPKWYDCLKLKQGTWDGRDLFTPQNGSMLLATQRLVDATVAHGIADLVFTPAEEAWWDDRVPGLRGRGKRPPPPDVTN